jgi:hypothetical protein
MNILQKNKDITDLSNFKTKAFSRYYFEISSEYDLDNLFKVTIFANENDLKILFI